MFASLFTDNLPLCHRSHFAFHMGLSSNIPHEDTVHYAKHYWFYVSRYGAKPEYLETCYELWSKERFCASNNHLNLCLFIIQSYPMASKYLDYCAQVYLIVLFWMHLSLCWKNRLEIFYFLCVCVPQKTQTVSKQASLGWMVFFLNLYKKVMLVLFIGKVSWITLKINT